MKTIKEFLKVRVVGIVVIFFMFVLALFLYMGCAPKAEIKNIRNITNGKVRILERICIDEHEYVYVQMKDWRFCLVPVFDEDDKARRCFKE